MINDVPQVACFGESHFVDRLLLPIAKNVRDYNQMMKTVEEQVYEGCGYYAPVNDPELLCVMRAWLVSIFQRTAGERWETLLAVGDKTPAHSFHMHTLRALMPNSRFVHMLRDGRDAAVSNYYHRARALKVMGKLEQLRPIEEEVPGLFVKWRKFTQAVLAQQQQGCTVHTLRYEDLKAHPLLELQALIRFLLPESSFDNQSLINAIKLNDFKQQTGGRNPGEVSDTSFLRQGISGGWRKELGNVQDSFWDREGIELLSKLGYSVEEYIQ